MATTFMTLQAKSIIFVLGGPGSGKGTNCSKICNEFECTHLCVGDLLRKEAESDSEQGKQIHKIMKDGQLVSPEMTAELLGNAIDSTANSTVFLIDGFPRNLGQAELFEKKVGKCQAVLVFNCSDKVMKERIMKRGQSSGRIDDNKVSIEKRLRSHATDTLPVIEYYRKKLGGNVHTINAEQTVDEVYAEVRSAFSQILQDQARL